MEKNKIKLRGAGALGIPMDIPSYPVLYAFLFFL
jgi:hypothetical protein